MSTGTEHLPTNATLATPANMRAVEEKGNAGRAVAWSPITGEEYSATAGDYWDRPDDEPLRDQDGDPLILVYFPRSVVDALTGKPLS